MLREKSEANRGPPELESLKEEMATHSSILEPQEQHKKAKRYDT